jgi:prolyl 4-hydroxylase
MITGAEEALLRLQDTYKLDTTLLADGVIPIHYIRDFKTGQRGVRPPENQISLTANDCFKLGRQAYFNKDYYRTVLWMQEAIDRLDKEESVKPSDRVNILEYLAFATYLRGNVRQALQLTHQLLELSPEHPRALGNIELYEKKLAQHSSNKNESDGKVPLDETIIESEKTSTLEETEMETYKALCRGEKRMSEKTQSGLLCFYLNTRQIPYLKLMRFKVEEAFKKPQIVMFHDFLSDSEIEVVKTLAEPMLKRAKVIANSTAGTSANYRISDSAWLKNRDHEVIDRISRRISDVTGLDLSTAEELQVANYGIGGHYAPHLDFFKQEDDFKSLGLKIFIYLLCFLENLKSITKLELSLKLISNDY